MAIARGEHRSTKDEPTVWFTSIESFAIRNWLLIEPRRPPDQWWCGASASAAASASRSTGNSGMGSPAKAIWTPWCAGTGDELGCEPGAADYGTAGGEPWVDDHDPGCSVDGCPGKRIELDRFGVVRERVRQDPDMRVREVGACTEDMVAEPGDCPKVGYRERKRGVPGDRCPASSPCMSAAASPSDSRRTRSWSVAIRSARRCSVRARATRAQWPPCRCLRFRRGVRLQVHRQFRHGLAGQERLDSLGLGIALGVRPRRADHEVALAVDLPLPVGSVGPRRDGPEGPRRRERPEERRRERLRGARAGWRALLGSKGSQFLYLSKTSRFKTAVTT